MMERQSEVQPLQNLYGFVAYWAAKNKKIPFLRDKDAAKLYDELLANEKDCEKAGKEKRDEPTDWGHTFADDRHRVARPSFGSEGYGLKEDWTFSTIFCQIFGWEKYRRVG